MTVFFSGRSTIGASELTDDPSRRSDVIYFALDDPLEWDAMMALDSLSRETKCVVVTWRPHWQMVGMFPDHDGLDVHTSFILHYRDGELVEDSSAGLFLVDRHEEMAAAMSSVGLSVEFHPAKDRPVCLMANVPSDDCLAMFRSWFDKTNPTIYNELRMFGRTACVVHCGTESIVVTSKYSRSHPRSTFVGDVSGPHSRLAGSCDLRVNVTNQADFDKVIEKLWTIHSEAQ